MSRWALTLLLTASLFFTQSKALAAVWSIDSSASWIKFTIGNFGLMKTNGAINEFFGRIDYIPPDLTTIKVHAEIDADTIQTGILQRDNHLKTKDFFDVPKYPLWFFDSTNIEAISPAHFKMKGILKMHGIEKEVTLDCHGPNRPRQTQKGDKASLTATGETNIDRRDFGIKGGRPVVGEIAHIVVHIRVVESTESDVADEERARVKLRKSNYKDAQSKKPNTNKSK